MTGLTVGEGDVELVEGLRHGDEGAVEALAARHGPWIYRLALRLTGSPPDAEEITQDAHLRVVQKMATFKGEAAFTSWVYRIAANLAYQKLRNRSRGEEVSLDAVLPTFDEMGAHAKMVADWSDRVDDRVLAAEVRQRLEEAIERLPPDYKVVFVLHDIEERSNAEVAQLLHLSLPAIKSRVHRARLFLRGKLAEYFERRA